MLEKALSLLMMAKTNSMLQLWMEKPKWPEPLQE